MSTVWQRLSNLLICSLLSINVYAVAYAQMDAQENTDSSASDGQMSISITPSGVKLNIETCSQISAEQEFVLRGDYTTPQPPNQGTLSLTATLGNSCDLADTCNKTQLEGNNCSCLDDDEDTLTTISHTFRITDLLAEPCVDGEEQIISFFLHFDAETPSVIPGGSPTTTELKSPAVKITIDMKAPNAPTEAPSIRSAENSLLITVPEVGGDIDTYEVCVQASESSETPVCESILADMEYRFEGLDNNKAYTVTYRVYDSAGNSSDDSPEASATPAEVRDFAEIYSADYPGGERGGCMSRSSARPLLSGCLLFLGLLGLNQLRRKGDRT